MRRVLSVASCNIVLLSVAVFLTVFAVSATASADEFRVSPPVSEAVVFGSGALVTRVAEIEAPAGSHQLIFEGLPEDFEGYTVRVAVTSGPAQIGSVTVVTVEHKEVVADRQRQLQAQLTALHDREQELKDRIRAAELQVKFLEGLAEGYPAESRQETARGQADPATWQRALDLFASGSSAAYGEIRTANQALRDVTAEIEAAERELKRIGRGRQSEDQVSIAFESPSAGTSQFALTFLVDDAHWEPTYDARLNSETGDIQLSRFGSVAQNTGEDWQNISLTLATGRPAEESRIPDISPIYVDFEPEKEETTVTGSRIRRTGFETVAPKAEVDAEFVDERGFAGVAEALNEVPAFSLPSVLSSGIATRYGIPGRVSLAATGDAQQFLIEERDFDSKLRVSTAPEDEQRGYLYGVITNDGEDILYGGTVSAFVDGVFTGTSVIESIQAGEEGNIPFGADDNVRVSYKPQGTEDSESGILSRRKTEISRALVKVENFHARPVEIEVLGQLPVSRNENIQVEFLDEATKPDETDIKDLPGVFKWLRTLEPGASAEFNYSYRITYPRDRQITYDYDD